ncbi:hypothetical protein EV356DRAFT_505021 [Viridothelium virens]|uniref:Uncharacterized protein n=1 Tax=Viridothelium virens TaxID=1048519 RepID=A0A6A6H3R0_VIRVR|nr:hypothetical protein EV356DRAFT_505021 [Viridothelium virens]
MRNLAGGLLVPIPQSTQAVLISFIGKGLELCGSVQYAPFDRGAYTERRLPISAQDSLWIRSPGREIDTLQAGH